MIFNVIIIALVGGIAYFHYAQGFFSATISAIIAVIAAAIAVGYHEVVMNALLQGRVADYATGLTLVGLFALIYLLLRVLTDKAIPGNVRLPVIVDRIGGAAMGIVAAIFSTGVFAVAAQSMPFGPEIGGFARYPVEDRPDVIVPPGPHSRGRSRDVDIYAQLKNERFEPGDRQSLWIPVDDVVLGFVQALSDGGSMSGERTLESVHPNYTDELFAQRLGIQIGAQLTAVNIEGRSPMVSVPEEGVFRVDADLTKGHVDGELPGVHQRPVEPKRTPPDEMQLVLRVMFHRDSRDTDGFARVSPGAVRLMANGKNYYPIGTLENGRTLWTNAMDDFLLINIGQEDRGADFVFFVNPADVLAGGAAADRNNQTIADGVFIEVKRLARIDLSGRDVRVGVTPAKNVQVERKPTVVEAAAEKKKEAPAPAEGEAPDPAAEGEKKGTPMQTIRQGVNQRNEALEQ